MFSEHRCIRQSLVLPRTPQTNNNTNMYSFEMTVPISSPPPQPRCWSNGGLNRSLSNKVSSTLKNQTFKGLPENHILQVKGVLYYTRGGHSDPEYVLLGRHIARVRDTIQCIQIAGAHGKEEMYLFSIWLSSIIWHFRKWNYLCLKLSNTFKGTIENCLSWQQ